MKRKNSLRKLLFTAACFAVMIITAEGQSTLITHAHAVISPSGNACEGTFTVLLTDTGNVSQVSVTLGSESGGSNLVSYTFNYDVSTSLPAGFSYARLGNMLTLGVGTFDPNSTYFGTVRIKDSNNSWRSPYSFITN